VLVGETITQADVVRTQQLNHKGLLSVISREPTVLPLLSYFHHDIVILESYTPAHSQARIDPDLVKQRINRLLTPVAYDNVTSHSFKNATLNGMT
jgi:hypothetical protein